MSNRIETKLASPIKTVKTVPGFKQIKTSAAELSIRLQQQFFMPRDNAKSRIDEPTTIE
jgi:hypothetical protein